MAPQSIVDVVLLFIQNTRSLDNEDDGHFLLSQSSVAGEDEKKS